MDFISRHSIVGKLFPRSTRPSLIRLKSESDLPKEQVDIPSTENLNSNKENIGNLSHDNVVEDDDASNNEIDGPKRLKFEPGAHEEETEKCFRESYNKVDFLSAREMSLSNLSSGRFWTERVNTENNSFHLLENSMFQEFQISVPRVNKAYCSQWLNEQQIIFGTKCNKLMIYDIKKQKFRQVESLSSVNHPKKAFNLNQFQRNEIHSIQMNPSRSLLATVAKSTNNIAIYKFPTFDPVCIGETAHSDCIFDIKWLDDEILVSGSRDASMALWRVKETTFSPEKVHGLYGLYLLQGSISPAIRKICKTADTVRSICFNDNLSQIVSLSTNGYIHCWDAIRFQQTMSRRLPRKLENVCLAMNKDKSYYAVGSKRDADLIDTRTLQNTRNIRIDNRSSGVRSLSFNGKILTIGTGSGTLQFWDLTAGKFIPLLNTNQTTMESILKVSRGFMYKEENSVWKGINENKIKEQGNQRNKRPPAIYTHNYDHSGTRLFVAGGPLENGFQGNYMGIFQ